MRISRRIGAITGGGPDGWEVFNRARDMAAAGEAVVELTIGEHDTGTDAAVLAAMQASAAGGNTGYAPVPGNPALREAVAERVARRTGVATGAANVLVTPGGQAGLFAAHLAAADPGDVALYCDPFYTTYPGTLRANGLVPRAVPCRPEAGFEPLEADLAECAAGARSLLINTPNNPTGAVYSEATLAGIARVCEARDLWLVSDEVYDTQVWEGAHVSPRALPGMAERTIVVGSMSKSHAMTGSRIGWIVAPEAVVERLIDLSTVTTYGVPGFIQDAALFALRAGAEAEAAVAAPFRRRHAIAARVFAGHDSVRLLPGRGAMYVMLDIRATGLSGSEFADRLLDTERIAVMPGESFGACAAGHLRIALTVPDDRLEESLGRIARFAARQAA